VVSIVLRGRTLQLRRRVQERYRSVEPRGVIWISLHTDSETIARSKAALAWAQLIEAWEARLAGDTGDAAARHEAAQALARVRGFRYLDVAKVAELPAAELLARIEALERGRVAPNAQEAAALLGTVPSPEITLEKALDLYWTLAREKTLGKSEDQLRRWKNPRVKAVRNFVEIIGNKPIGAITRDDLLDFRQHWLERIEAGEVTPNSANKDLIHLGDILKTVNTMKRLGLTLPLGELSFKEARCARARPSRRTGSNTACWHRGRCWASTMRRAASCSAWSIPATGRPKVRA
jgi:hypothetical protein